MKETLSAAANHSLARFRVEERGKHAMPRLTEADLLRMEDGLFFDGPERARKLTRYWTLLVLAAIIASAGIVGDSTATVIGAMIVAPLMTPILGTVLAVVQADFRNLVRSALLVVGGAGAVVLIALALGRLVTVAVLADSNSQVASRVHPRLIDLIAALATGAVGAFALVRSDVSDTLPGVAIAISLVPPLAVVGLTLESGRPHQAVGALLLFLTNVGAILLSGLVVMAIYRVGAASRRFTSRATLSSRIATALAVVAVIALAVPLGAASKRITSEELTRSDVSTVARKWADPLGWDILTIDSSERGVLIRSSGPPPLPDAASFRRALDEAGLEAVDVRLELTLAERVDLPGG